MGDFCLRMRETAPLGEQARLAAKKADHDNRDEKFWRCNLSDQSCAVVFVAAYLAAPVGALGHHIVRPSLLGAAGHGLG